VFTVGAFDDGVEVTPVYTASVAVNTGSTGLLTYLHVSMTRTVPWCGTVEQYRMKSAGSLFNGSDRTTDDICVK